MTPDPVVVFAATPRGWAGRLRAHAADHGGLLVRATVLTPEDARAEQCDVVVVDDITSFLTRRFVRDLHDSGRSVLGVYDPGDTHGKGELIDAGVDAVIEIDADTTAFVAQLSRLAAVHPDDRPPRPEPIQRPRADGRLIGVTGPAGGVGVTEVAVEVAATLAATNRRTALVDLDESGPSLAQRLGLALHPNLHTATTLLEQSEPMRGVVQPLTNRQQLNVLTGMPSGEDWETIRPGAIERVTDQLRHDHQVVVTDLGHLPATVEGATGLRFGHARVLAHRCDVVLVVTAPTPVAIARTMSLLAALDTVRQRTHLVLNRVTRDRYVRDEAMMELSRAVGGVGVHTIAEHAGVGRAAWQGGRVTRGPFRRDVRALVGQLGVAR
ncbi:AAA family ATPase [Euzebya tangerina]|uniref:AAA family ATPase n=1 Tax=Euzebya tangerina TaxID=591198 RepID=UPI000E31D280|nr:P-loop NTPase [Euzebya tangerina]